MSRGSRNAPATALAAGAVATVLAAGALVSVPSIVADEKDPPELPPIPEGPPESIHAEAVFVESDVVAENRRLREQLESQRVFFEARLQEQAATFDASWEAREREFAAQLQAPPLESPMTAFERTPIGTYAATVLGHRPRRAVFDASVPLTVAGKRVTYGPGDPVPDHIDPETLPVGAARYVSEED